MKLAAITLGLLSLQLFAQEQFDFISIIKSEPGVAKSIGLQKLTPEEQLALNRLLNQTYQFGIESAANPQRPAAPARADKNQPPRAAARPVYITRISDDNDDVLSLDNGAIVEITGGFLGFVGLNKQCALYKQGQSWRIWIEGKREFLCALIKAPAVRPSGQAEKISISEVAGGGKILKGLDGSIYEVDDFSTFDTALWLAPFEALLIDGTQMLNLDEGGEIAGVSKVR